MIVPTERCEFHLGDCRAVLRGMEAESVHACITSPPYWSLRDYGLAPSVWGGRADCEHSWGEEMTARQSGGGLALGGNQTGGDKEWDLGPKSQGAFCGHCSAWLGCLGLEPTPVCRSGECGACFVCHIVEVFREVRRVLRKDGVAFINLGDSYAVGKCGRDDDGPEDLARRAEAYGTGVRKAGEKGANGIPRSAPPGYKAKDLMMMPAEVALALRRDGWWLRSCCIWEKLNPLPESVRDRPTTSHEYVFLLAKSASYYYDADAVREQHARLWDPETNGQGANFRGNLDPRNDPETQEGHRGGRCPPNPAGRNLRTVWSFATESYPHSHFATYPQKLVEPCVKAGSSEFGCCPAPGCGAPWRRVVEREFVPQPDVCAEKGIKGHADQKPMYAGSWEGVPRGSLNVTTTGWQPTCTHDLPPQPCVILDPFAGSGTTGAVAVKLGRRAILIDQNAQYLALAQERIAREPTRLFAVPGEVRPKKADARRKTLDAREGGSACSPPASSVQRPASALCPETLTLPEVAG